MGRASILQVHRLLRGGEEKIQTEATFLGAIQQGKEGLLILSPDDFIDHLLHHHYFFY